nr:TenA family protein [uncultured Lichenicoccus sp.]
MTFDFQQVMPYLANTLYGNLRRDAGPDWDAYVEHPFVKALADGSLPKEEFLAWMVQDYLYLIHYTRAYALLIFKSVTTGQMRSASEIVHGLLTGEMSLHRRQLHEAGIGDYEIAATPETLETLAYSRYILDRGQTGDMLDLTVTLSACLAGYGEIGLRLLQDPTTRLEGNPYRDWIETYGGQVYHDLVKEGLARLETLSESHGGAARYPMLLKEFREAVRLEAAFWNAGRSALAANPERAGIGNGVCGTP